MSSVVRKTFRYPRVHGRSALLLLGLMAVGSGTALAQPAGAAPEQFGDRQIGRFGDPTQGHFGNPAKGNFDVDIIKAPAPGTRPLGRVYQKKPVETPPYVSLPTPKDAAPADASAKTAPEAAKPRAKPAAKKP